MREFLFWLFLIVSLSLGGSFVLWLNGAPTGLFP